MEWINGARRVNGQKADLGPQKATVKIPERVLPKVPEYKNGTDKPLERNHKEDGMTIGNAANNASQIVNCMKDIIIARGNIKNFTDDELFNVLTAWWDLAFDSVLATTTGRKKVKPLHDGETAEVVE